MPSKSFAPKQCPGCKRNLSASSAGRLGSAWDKGICINRNCRYFVDGDEANDLHFAANRQREKGAK